MIPAKQFATTGRTAIDGVMAKQLGFCPANTLHITSVVDSVDAEQCYDAVNHAVTSVGLQAHHVPIMFVLLYLQAMAEMQFHLRTGFGRFGGLGHQSGGTPSAWQVVSGMVLGAYKRAGYGVQMHMASFLWLLRSCLLTTVTYYTCALIQICRILSSLHANSKLCNSGPSY